MPISVRSSKGIVDIARLIAVPGRDVHCLDLMGAVLEDTSTGEVIDARARREYEERIRELQTDVDAAEADNDIARAERAQAELDALVDHLTATLGYGRRVRRGVDSAERARSAVTHRIRSTIRHLDSVHPQLAAHLRASITTGHYCSYRPEHPVDWHVG
jgi:hypothetical protein